MGGMIQALANYDPDELARKNRESDARIAALQAETGSTQVGTQSKQLENQLTQQSLKDADILRRAYVNTSGDPAELRRYMLSNGISAPGFLGWQKHDMELRQNAMKLTSEQHAQLAQTHADAGNMLDSFKNIQDPQLQRQTYAQFLPALQKLAPDVQWKAPAALTPDDLELYTGVLGHAQATLNAAKAKAETEKFTAEAGEKTAATGEAEAKTSGIQRSQAIQQLLALDPQDPDAYNAWAGVHPELNPPNTYNAGWVQRQTRSLVPAQEVPEYDIKSHAAAAMQGLTPADLDRQVDDVVPPSGDTAQLNQRTKAQVRMAVGAGLPLSAVQAVIKDASDQIGRTETGVRTAKATAPIKIEVAGATAGARANQAGLAEDDYQRAGEQYIRTGVMPAMGRDSVTRGKIVHYGNQWARDNGLSPADVITMQAAYAGDKESLKKFQSTRDQIASFEQTAQKNLDLMLAAGQKLIDTGSPALNKPLRSLNRSALGSTEQAAFDAAQLIAQNEVAKVTSGGGLGGVVSDSAKSEMRAAMGRDPTIAQMMAVAKIMKQDMANRHGAMDATLNDIKSRIGGTPGAGRAAQAPAAERAPTLPARLAPTDVGKTFYSSKTGKNIKVTAVSPDGTKMQSVEVP